MSAPRLLFGIGAAKAGTSWLHDYLMHHPDCAMPRIKELHFFDTIEHGSHERRLKVLAREHVALTEKLSDLRASGRMRRAAAMTDRIHELEHYADVVRSGDVAAYAGFLDQLRGDRALVGDVTPAYALLPGTRLAEMAKIGPAVRFIYLLRDPVDRLWSNIRMVAHRRAKGADPAPFAHQIFDRVISGQDNDNFLRSDYRACLTRLAASVPGPQVLVEFFERLFSETAIRNICDFLGISYAQPAFAKVVHKGKSSLLLDPARRSAARAFLAPQYDYVTARMGGVPERWQRGDL